jgi:hypothetical protein
MVVASFEEHSDVFELFHELERWTQYLCCKTTYQLLLAVSPSMCCKIFHIVFSCAFSLVCPKMLWTYLIFLFCHGGMKCILRILTNVFFLIDAKNERLFWTHLILLKLKFEEKHRLNFKWNFWSDRPFKSFSLYRRNGTSLIYCTSAFCIFFSPCKSKSAVSGWQ